MMQTARVYCQKRKNRSRDDQDQHGQRQGDQLLSRLAARRDQDMVTTRAISPLVLLDPRGSIDRIATGTGNQTIQIKPGMLWVAI